MKVLLALVLLTMGNLSVAGDWVPLKTEDGDHWEFSPSTYETGNKPGKPKDPVVLILSVWVRTIGTTNKQAQKQVWIDCSAREANIFDAVYSSWTGWQPIPPETMPWGVWNRLCKVPGAQKDLN